MPYARPTLTQLISQGQQDVQDASLPGVDGLLDPSVLGVLGYAIAGMSYEHYGYQDWIAKQATPWGATGEYATGWGALKGVYQKPATSAIVAVQFTGVASTDFPSGSGVSSLNGLAFTSTSDNAVSTTGLLTAQVTASAPGAAYNLQPGTQVVLTSPISGINASGAVTAIVTPGTDQESASTFKTRYLAAYSTSPQGGAPSDYERWALAIPGVTRAWCGPPGALGAGTVVVWVMLDEANAAFGGFPQGSNGAAAAEKRYVTATGNQLTVANAIYPLRPVTAIVVVTAPTAYPIDVTIGDASSTDSAMNAAVAAALTDLWLSDGDPNGVTLQPSQIYAALNSVSDLGAFDLIAPAAPIQVPAGSLPTNGTITLQ